MARQQKHTRTSSIQFQYMYPCPVVLSSSALCMAASSIRPTGRVFCKATLLNPLITLCRQSNEELCRTQRPRDLRRGIEAARLQGLWVRIQTRAWKFVSCDCCVLSGTYLCIGLYARPEESYRVW